jgi:hypothetical protein
MPVHRKVSASEKYAEVGAARPSCCGEPKRWRASTRYRAGGFWHCAVKVRETVAHWNRANPERTAWRNI